MSDNKNSKQDSRLTGLETDMKWVKGELKKIRDNHLPHIRSELKMIRESLASRPSWLTSGIITGIVSLLTGLIVFVLT